MTRFVINISTFSFNQSVLYFFFLAELFKFTIHLYNFGLKFGHYPYKNKKLKKKRYEIQFKQWNFTCFLHRCSLHFAKNICLLSLFYGQNLHRAQLRFLFTAVEDWFEVEVAFSFFSFRTFTLCASSSLVWYVILSICKFKKDFPNSSRTILWLDCCWPNLDSQHSTKHTHWNTKYLSYWKKFFQRMHFIFLVYVLDSWLKTVNGTYSCILL